MAGHETPEQKAQRWTDETTIKRLHIEDGRIEMDLRPPQELMVALAMGLADSMRAMGADNWVTFTINHPDLGPLDMTLQRRNGETPSDQLTKVKAWKERATKAINGAMADMEWDAVPAAECGETWGYVAEFQRLVGHPLSDEVTP